MMVRLPPSPVPPARVSVSSYRLQFSEGFTFADARAVVPYLAALGVTEVYCSPLLQATPGSTHGYDICDPTRLNAELGTDVAFERLSAALTECGLGLILDIVPNHMAADPRHNRWWCDVLRHGERSAFAHWFDIDWRRSGCEGRVLLPILGADLATVLARRELRLVFEEGAFWMAYFEHRVPIDATRAGLDTTDPARVTADVNAVPRGSAYPARLAAVLESLPVRLANWRDAVSALNYRRFFDIAGLVGLRVEAPDVFAAVHARILALVRQGLVTGLRVDHPDGLRDPTGYLADLQRAARPENGVPAYVLVEKILSPGERLPAAWRGVAHGTTGYTFLNDVNGLFVDPRAARPLADTYARLTGRSVVFPDVVHAAKRHVLETMMAVELERLGDQLAPLVPEWSAETTRRVLTELVACFPIYRTYVTAAGATEADRHAIGVAVGEAVRRCPADGARFAEVGRLLALETPGAAANAVPFVMRFQQLTGAVQAKGLEDTAGYRHPVLLSLNEVGGAPDLFGRSVEAFHRANAERREQWPLEMLATATHDAKRGEDARARIDALSEVPRDWEQAVDRWFAINAAARSRIDGASAPAPADEYLYYQTLIGAWPAGPASAPVPRSAPDELVERVGRYMRKAVKEAKERTSWLDPDTRYETAVAGFIRETLAGSAAASFLAAFVPFQRRVARLGLLNSLSQVVLKIAAPGVPDFYQGTELWDFSLVDPDNRRPVDYKRRRAVLASLAPWLDPNATGAALADTLARLLAHPWDGTIKCYVTARGLACRRAHRDLAVWGDYTPLVVTGSKAAHLVAFARRLDGAALVAVAPRLSGGVTSDDEPYPLGVRAWGDTLIRLPAVPGGQSYTHALTGEQVAATDAGDGPHLRAADLFRTLPVALLLG